MVLSFSDWLDTQYKSPNTHREKSQQAIRRTASSSDRELKDGGLVQADARYNWKQIASVANVACQELEECQAVSRSDQNGRGLRPPREPTLVSGHKGLEGPL